MKRIPKVAWFFILVICVAAVLISLGAFYYSRRQDDSAFAQAVQQAQAAGTDYQSALKAFQDYQNANPEGIHSEEATKNESDIKDMISAEEMRVKQRNQAAVDDAASHLGPVLAQMGNVMTTINEMGSGSMNKSQLESLSGQMKRSLEYRQPDIEEARKAISILPESAGRNDYIASLQKTSDDMQAIIELCLLLGNEGGMAEQAIQDGTLDIKLQESFQKIQDTAAEASKLHVQALDELGVNQT